MLSAPADLNVADLRALVSRTWLIEPAEFHRLAVGGDSWSFRAGEWFINVRDAFGQRHSWRPQRDVEPALDAAIMLREQTGLDFLLAPTPTPAGRSVARLGRFAVSVMPYLEGEVHYRPYTRGELAKVTAWIARLHAVPVRHRACCLPVENFAVRCAGTLRAALQRAREADAGPYSTALRALTGRYGEMVLADLAAHEAAALRLRNRHHDLVITHGEPFPGNVFHSTDGRRWLIDLSELALAPKERDLGCLTMLAAASDREIPEQVYGAPYDPDRAKFYQQRWGLEEITIGIDHLSRPHTGTTQDDDVWSELTTHYLPMT